MRSRSHLPSPPACLQPSKASYSSLLCGYYRFILFWQEKARSQLTCILWVTLRGSYKLTLLPRQEQNSSAVSQEWAAVLCLTLSQVFRPLPKGSFGHSLCLYPRVLYPEVCQLPNRARPLQPVTKSPGPPEDNGRVTSEHMGP